jgi:hypothetical protein
VLWISNRKEIDSHHKFGTNAEIDHAIKTTPRNYGKMYNPHYENFCVKQKGFQIYTK